MPRYEPPVSLLFDLPTPDFEAPDAWPDYVATLGLGPEHVPELLRMATDPELYEVDWGRESARYDATIHARRALGQLRAVESVEPLLRTQERFGELDDYWLQELPPVFARIGPAAIEPLVATLIDPGREEYTRINCADALEAIAKAHPEARGRCVEALAGWLAGRRDGERNRTVNGFAVGALVGLGAVEAAEVIEQAFAAGVVDATIVGDWEMARYELGLGPKPERLRRSPLGRYGPAPGDRPRRPDPQKAKQKRKQQEMARKRNRKRG